MDCRKLLHRFNWQTVLSGASVTSLTDNRWSLWWWIFNTQDKWTRNKNVERMCRVLCFEASSYWDLTIPETMIQQGICPEMWEKINTYEADNYQKEDLHFQGVLLGFKKCGDVFYILWKKRLIPTKDPTSLKREFSDEVFMETFLIRMTECSQLICYPEYSLTFVKSDVQRKSSRMNVAVTSWWIFIRFIEAVLLNCKHSKLGNAR